MSPDASELGQTKSKCNEADVITNVLHELACNLPGKDLFWLVCQIDEKPPRLRNCEGQADCSFQQTSKSVNEVSRKSSLFSHAYDFLISNGVRFVKIGRYLLRGKKDCGKFDEKLRGKWLYCNYLNLLLRTRDIKPA